MKKVRIFLIFLMLIVPVTVKADHIYSRDIDIDILKDGTANITEIWDVKATGGSEWYKTMYELGGSKLSDYVVYMDGVKLTYKDNWDVNGSLSSKAGYYGINYTFDGMEFCFGKSDMKRHTFTLKYTLSNYIFNTSDSQVLYWNLIPKATVDYFSVDVTSYYAFPDTLDVWGFGHKGYAYVENGKIRMSEAKSLNNDSVILLVKFPLNTFDTNYTMDEFKTFDDVYKDARIGSFAYNYNFDSSDFIRWIMILCPFVIIIIMFFVKTKKTTEEKYGYFNNKKIDRKTVPMFRDIPCNKDIFYANILIKLNKFGYNKFNILGAIILKWVKEDKIKFINKKVGIFNRETSVIDLTSDPTFYNWTESELFSMMKTASKDGLLEVKEFEKWVKANYVQFINLFNRVESRYIEYLKNKSQIYKRTRRKDCRQKNILGDAIYNDSVQLYGLKKYLEEFSRMDTKEVIEVKLWNEYLMFAYLFGIADKVSKQLEDMYPEVLEEMKQINIDYDVIRFVDRISTRSINSANSVKSKNEFRKSIRSVARSAARSYSSGGGGHSRGGGGSGSRGGGSRGSSGGR